MPQRNRIARFSRTALPLLLGALLSAAPAWAERAQTAGATDHSANLQTVTADELRKQWGLAVEGIRPSAAGHMLDFRYRVLDVEKAARLIHRGLKPELIDKTRDVRLITPTPPKVGALRQTSSRLIEGRTYFVMFGNPGKRVGPGDRVAITLGQVVLDGLVVK